MDTKKVDPSIEKDRKDTLLSNLEAIELYVELIEKNEEEYYEHYEKFINSFYAYINKNRKFIDVYLRKVRKGRFSF